MRQLPVFFAFGLSLLTFTALSQGFKKGFVILPGEDTLYGFIQEDSYENLSRFVNFKPAKDADLQVFTPESLLAFGFREGDFFKSASVRFDLKNRRGQWETIAGERFLYRLAEGPVSLYELRDERAQPLFIQRGEMPVVVLCYDRAGHPEFVEILAAHLNECEFVKVPPSLPLSLPKILTLVENYNECSDAPERRKLPMLQVWASAGFASPLTASSQRGGLTQNLAAEWRPFETGFASHFTIGLEAQHLTTQRLGPGQDYEGYPFSKYKVDYWEYAVKSRFFLTNRKGSIMPYVFVGGAYYNYIHRKNRINPAESEGITPIKTIDSGAKFLPGVGVHAGFGRHIFRLEVPFDEKLNIRAGYGFVLWK